MIVEITKPPYEVTEVGWGEFEIIIQISFKEGHMAPLTVRHPLKLYPPGSAPQTKSIVS